MSDWQSVRHLLAVHLDDAESIDPAMQLLRRSLPQAAITVITPDDRLPDLQPGFEAAMIFTAPGRSPYAIAYLCYLAGIPIRVGQSIEFGGGVLSHWVKPPLRAVGAEYHLHLLRSVGLESSQGSLYGTAENPHLARSR